MNTLAFRQKSRYLQHGGWGGRSKRQTQHTLEPWLGFCFVNLSSWGGGGRTKESKHSDTERHLDFLSSFRDDLQAGLPMIKGQLVKPGWVLTVAQPFPELCDLRQAPQIL